MKELLVLAGLAASGMFAACRHPAPTPAKPAPREAPPLAQRPKRVDPMPIPVGVPSTQGAAYTVHVRPDRDDLIGDDDETPHPMSVKPDGGILYDGGAPLPPIPDGGSPPQMRDAGQPMSQ